MNVTREGDYAVLCVLEVARNGYMSTAEVARRHNVSPAFLGKIVQGLARAGILSTRRGVKGGIRLARPIEELTLLDVIEAAQGPLRLNLCMVCASYCQRSEHCAIYPIWSRAQRQLERTLRVTFKQIIDGDVAARAAATRNGKPVTNGKPISTANPRNPAETAIGG